MNGPTVCLNLEGVTEISTAKKKNRDFLAWKLNKSNLFFKEQQKSLTKKI